MGEKAINNRLEIQRIRSELLSGKITYDEAKTQAEPIIKDINDKAIAIAKKYNRKPYKISFIGLIR